MYFSTIDALASQISQKQIHPNELFSAFAQRCKQINPQINAFITLCERANIADTVHSENPLHGIPIAYKDLFCTNGVLTTCGSRMLENFIPPYDAYVCQQLNGLMPMLGKTNMDEFAMGSTNETSYFGACNNPWDTNRVSGGSSGGSAAAVAAGMVPVALGSDTGGSVRQPASYCGVSAIKPTYGRVSRWGMIAYASSFDQCGVIARSAKDCAYVLQAIAGYDHRDSTSVNIQVDDYIAKLEQLPKGLRIGIAAELFDTLDQQISERIFATLGLLDCTLVDISLPNIVHALPAYYVLALAECSSNMSRYDGIRYGRQCAEPKNIADVFMRSRSEGFGDELQKRILLGTYVLSHGYYDAYYIHAQKLRRLIKNDFVNAFSQVDIIASPVVPSVAPKQGEMADAVHMYQQDLYTVSANLCGIPAIALPMQPINAMPIGMQLLGNYFSETVLFQSAHAIQKQSDWHLQYPNM